MENTFVVIGYSNNQKFIAQIEKGPFNCISYLLNDITLQTKLGQHLSQDELTLLKTFELEKHGMEMEDTESWANPIFLKGKRDPVAFLAACHKLKSSLPIFLTKEEQEHYGISKDELEFNEALLNEFVADLEQLLDSADVKYITFYNFRV